MNENQKNAITENLDELRARMDTAIVVQMYGKGVLNYDQYQSTSACITDSEKRLKLLEYIKGQNCWGIFLNCLEDNKQPWLANLLRISAGERPPSSPPIPIRRPQALFTSPQRRYPQNFDAPPPYSSEPPIYFSVPRQLTLAEKVIDSKIYREMLVDEILVTLLKNKAITQSTFERINSAVMSDKKKLDLINILATVDNGWVALLRAFEERNQLKLRDELLDLMR
jgi:Caspase recruitment domain